MGLQSRLKEQRKNQRAELKDLAEFRCYYVATPTGNPASRVMHRDGKKGLTTWVFSSFQEAEDNARGLGEEYNLDLQVKPMSVGPFLGTLFNHLFQSDIDVLVTDGGVELPLTTFGVNFIGSEEWDNLLNEARQDDRKNPMLIRVIRDILTQVGGVENTIAVAAAPEEELVRLVMGKRNALPTVDLGIAWVLMSDETDRHEPVFIRVSGEDGNPDLSIGPLVFSCREAADNWVKIIDPDFAAKLMMKQLRLDGIRSAEFLQMASDQFPTLAEAAGMTPPDIFLLDGGLLPLTLLGAEFTEARIEYAEGHVPKDTWVSVAQARGVETLRRLSVRAAANVLEVEVVEVPEDASEATEPSA